MRPGRRLLLSGPTRRAQLERARLLLVFTPEACAGDPLEVLARAIEAVDLIQVRPKPLGEPRARTSAREALDWTRRVLALRADRPVPVLVNDRLDVARTLREEGCDGVHLGQDDAPPEVARALLGPEALIGRSTHDARQVALAGLEPVDYLGLGPVFPSATKGHSHALGPERVWVAAEGSPVPLFPIGGIDLSNADELDRVGRAAVCGGVLAADDPAAAARALTGLLSGQDA